MRQKGFAPIIILIFLLVVVGSGAYYFFTQRDKTLPNPTQISTASPASDLTTNWKIYTNTKFNFLLKYPPDWEQAQKTDMDKVFDEYKIKNFEAVFIDKSSLILGRWLSNYPALQIAVIPKNRVGLQYTLSMWVLKYLEASGIDYPEVNRIDPTVDFIKLNIEHNEALKYYDSVFISRGDYIYFVGLIFQGNPDKSFDRNAILDQILSTFKFTK